VAARTNTRRLRGQLPRLLAIGLIGSTLLAARLPSTSDSDRLRLASRFRFTVQSIPEPSDLSTRSIRQVNQSYERLSAWISSVGASIAMADLDGDEHGNDLCYVDPRSDQAVVAPAPTDAARYAPFTLVPTPLSYNPRLMAPMGCLAGDLNEDGRMDLLVYYWGRPPVAYLARARTHPPGLPSSQELSATTFRPFAIVPEHGSQVERWYTNAATLADLDGDGHDDLIIGNYFPDGSRVLDATARGEVTMQHSMSRAFNGGRNRFLLWTGGTSGANPRIRYREAPDVLSGDLGHGWTLAVGAADLNGDLRPEVYFANDFGPDRLLANESTQGHLRFRLLEGRRNPSIPASKVLGHDSFKGMGVDFGDLNEDGILDLFVSNITAPYALEESNFAFISTGDLGGMRHGTAPYVDRSEALGLSRSGWGWDAKLADFDNDGTLEAIQATGFVKGDVNRWPELQELAMGNDQLLENPSNWPRFQPGDDLSGGEHNPFFVKTPGGRYVDVSRELGLDRPMVSRGIAIGDAEGDGDLDFAVANQWEAPVFYRNDAPRPGAHLGLRLLRPPTRANDDRTLSGSSGPQVPNRPAIGASALVYLADGRILVQQIDGGNGHSGRRVPELLFGLGRDGGQMVEVDLRWRDHAGTVHQQRLKLPPGWHTVWLDTTATQRLTDS
jgi:hypothetical protein